MLGGPETRSSGTRYSAQTSPFWLADPLRTDGDRWPLELVLSTSASGDPCRPHCAADLLFGLDQVASGNGGTA